MQRILILATAALLVPPGVAAQHEHGASPYASMSIDAETTMSAEEVEKLRSGEGMGMALVAELNHYPGPKHALELAEMIGLSPEQIAELHTIREEMTERAISIGAEILALEAELTRMFRFPGASGDVVDDATSRIGGLLGKLRATHLKAHLRTRALLTPDQIQAYDDHRGYGSDS